MISSERAQAYVDAQRRRTRICVVGSGWRFTSGISYYTCRLANELSSSYDVSVLLMRRLIPAVFYPGRARVGRPVNTVSYAASVPVFDGVDWFWWPSLLRALRFLRRQQPDVLVLQWWTGAVLHTYAVLAALAHRRGARVVVEFHETQDTGESRIPFVAAYGRWIARRVLAKCFAIVVHSEFDRQAVLDHFPVDGLPVEVVPHGPYDHHLSPAPSVVPRADDMTLLFFGTIRPYKGLEHLVEAFGSLTSAEVEGLRLVVVGETWEGWTRPLDLVAASPHRDRITVVNRYVHDDEVAAFFAAADAVVLPYTRSSASGPLHIAMAAGLPTVVTDVGGLRAAAGDYAGAVWVPPADPSALRSALLDMRHRRGERYTDPRSWADTVAAYDRLIGDGSVSERELACASR